MRGCSRPWTRSAWSTCCRCTTATPPCCSANGSAPTVSAPDTAASAATCHRRWSTGPAWTSRRGARTSCWWLARRCGERERGCAPTANALATPSRTTPCRCPKAVMRMSRWPGRPKTASVWTARRSSTRCSSRRCASARGSRSTSTASASVDCGRGSMKWRCRIRMPGFVNLLQQKIFCRTGPRTG